MDALQSTGFYVTGLVIVAGIALSVAPPLARFARFSALVIAIGVAGAVSTLAAGFAAIVVFVALGSVALVDLRNDRPLTAASAVAQPWRTRAGQLALLAAAVAFVAIAFVALRGDFHSGAYPGGRFGSAVLARLLFTRDVLATEAVAAMAVALAVGGALTLPAARGRRR